MQKRESCISFVLDGKRVDLNLAENKIAPTTTVLHYLRSLPGHKGVKEGCGEGDCGACTVVLAELIDEKIQYRAVDSCLIFLPQLHGKQLITIENLNHENHLHFVQTAIVEENATQCGFCTPGVAMSIFAMCKQTSKADHDEIKQTLSGNLCRCTGYQSIKNAAEVANLNRTDDHFCLCEHEVSELLKTINSSKNTLIFKTEKQVYMKPLLLDEALRLKSEFSESLIVSGSTDVALRVTKKHETLASIIDISDVDELSFFKKEMDMCIAGSLCSLEQLRIQSKKDLPVLFEMLSVFGSKQIRNMATIGGNIGSASPIGDTIPVLFAYKAEVVMKNLKGERTIPIEDFICGYRQTVIHPDELIVRVHIPIPTHLAHIKSYKVSKRKDLDISTVSACFRLVKGGDEKPEDIILAFGGMSAYTQRAIQTEQFLKQHP